MPTTACIVQARLGSTRLPAKVLLPLPTGRTVLEEVLYRCKQIPGIDVVVCAIPDTAENDILVPFTERALGTTPPSHGGWGTAVRGPEHDVLARYAKAAETVNADVIMRITADCPLIDPEVCGQVLGAYRAARDIHGNVEYCSNVMAGRRTYPHGFDCEVFSREILDCANATVPALNAEPGGITWFDETDVDAMLRGVRPAALDREHVTPWIIRRAEQCRWIAMPNGENRSHLRWTLDTLEDYTRIWGIFERRMREAA